MRKAITYRIGDLLETHCEGCKKIPFARSSSKGIAWCGKNCDIGKELKKLGEQLDKTVNPRREPETMSSRGVLTQESYEQAKSEGLSEKEVAKAFGISVGTLWNRKNVWNINNHDEKLVKKQTTPKKKKRKAAESTSLAVAWKEEYAELEKANDTLQRKYEAAINENTELKEKYDRLYLDKQEIRDQFNKTCEDLEEEIESLKEELSKRKDLQLEFSEGAANQLLKMNEVVKEKDALLESIESRYGKETDRLNAINLELHEKLEAYKMALKVSL